MSRHADSSPFSRTDLVAALAVVVIWGVNFVAMKVALHHFTPFQLGAARYIFAVLPLVLVFRPPKVAARWVILYGLAQGVGQFGLLFMALSVGMTAALASVLMQTQVFFTALFGYVLLGERLSRPLQLGLTLAGLGLLCFAMNYASPAGPAAMATTALGFVLNLAAASMWATSNIVARRAQQTTSSEFDATAFVVWSSLVPILPFIGFSLMVDDASLRWQWTLAPFSSWIAVAYLGWIATITAYALWTGLLKRHPASRVAPFSLGVPVVGLAAGMVVLGESVTDWQWGGIVLIVLALATVMLGPRVLARLGQVNN
jgi:O-acetylserine/cysteine efflux transporter